MTTQNAIIIIAHTMRFSQGFMRILRYFLQKNLHCEFVQNLFSQSKIWSVKGSVVMARRGENIYKRKDGRYEGRYIKYYDINGKAVYGYVYSRNYSEIKDLLAKCRLGHQAKKSGSNILLCDWLKAWIESQVFLKATTKRVYKSHIENCIIPIIGKIPLKNLSADILQHFINNLELSAATVKTVFSILKSALSAAEDKGYITNIWSKVKVPKKNTDIVRILTESEQVRLESVLNTNEDIGIWVCLYTGLRIGEMCALKWKNIDFEASVLTVAGTQARTEKGLEVTSPKSESSKRKIPIPAFLLEKLRSVPHTSEYVLSKNHKAYDTRSYRRYFKRVLEKAELPDIKYHSLRHTFATRALEVGMDYKTLSEILGHSTVAITLDLYAHSLDEHKKRQMDKLGEIHKP